MVEAVISLQFKPIAALTAAHVGLYWNDCLGKDQWPSVSEADLLENAFEKFGNERVMQRLNSVRLAPAETGVRLQFVSRDEQQMIQVQRSRFAYNWRKRDGDYLTFDKLYPLFVSHFEQFRGFAHGMNLEVSINQWEITYVNKITRGELWNSPSDIGGMFPFLTPPVSVSGQELESLNQDWRFVIGKPSGRLHVSVRHGREGSTEGPEILVVELTARGPLVSEGTFQAGLELGHEHLVRTFAGMTSASAHEHWRRTQ